MIEEIYSKAKPGLLLHAIIRPAQMSVKGRSDLAHENEFLQLAVLNVSKGVTFKPHKHIWKDGPTRTIAQESWVCLKGSVKCFFYDVDDKLISTPILKAGDVSLTLQGGHTYEIAEDSLILEFKSGPYKGQENDKIMI